ncbi:hypothetical protein [Nonomuraea sp. NPDC052265]|uniref:hypothetical protein n=1 Tax=Nonomuraea sp. NPDC052265 TaxID=3364374 RepID=UPI0037C88B76
MKRRHTPGELMSRTADMATSGLPPAPPPRRHLARRHAQPGSTGTGCWMAHAAGQLYDQAMQLLATVLPEAPPLHGQSTAPNEQCDAGMPDCLSPQREA